jgi:hypothetical protein
VPIDEWGVRECMYVKSIQKKQRKCGVTLREGKEQFVGTMGRRGVVYEVRTLFYESGKKMALQLVAQRNVYVMV